MHILSANSSIVRLFLLCLFMPGVSASTVPLAAQSTLERGLLAHGGVATWQSFGLLNFELTRDNTESHTIDLFSRKTLNEGDGYTVGFDGELVWVAPNLEAYSGNPRFSNGLYFYFFAMPFVFDDPGVHAQDAGQRIVSGQTYDAVEISFGEGTGSSPDDVYIAHFHPETNQLAFVLYSVTFYSQSPSNNLNAIVFDEFQEAGGLQVPAKVSFYRWNKENSVFGDKRGEALFKNVLFSQQAPDPSVFARPEGAVIAVD